MAAIPGGHPYIRAITDPAAVAVLPDPVPPGAEAGRWWPPQMLDARWIRDHSDEFDVFHLHFGAESFSPGHVGAAIAAAQRAGKPVIYTVHDLQNPQLSDQGEHERMLDEVIPVVDVLVTLTAAARDEIAERWRRDAIVIPHPSLLEVDAPLGHPRDTTRVGVHLRDLRPNIDAVGVVTTLIRAVAELRAAGSRITARVHLNERVRDEETAELLAHLVADADGDTVELVRTPRLSDDDLVNAVADVDACILPYAYGTHSGWLELCFDLAVPVIGPRRGHFRDQHPSDYSRYDIGDPLSLAGAIERATSPAWSRPGSAARAAEVSARSAQRLAERAEVRGAHARLYRSLVAHRTAA